MKREKKNTHLLRTLVNKSFAIFPENYFLGTTHYRVLSGRIPKEFDGFRIVQISDLHGRSFGRENQRLLAAVGREHPDLIALTGDIVDRLVQDFGGAVRFVRTLCRTYHVCFVLGNHEQGLPGQCRIQFENEMRSAGVKILDNNSEEIRRGSTDICISGLRVPLRYYRAGVGAKPRPVLTKEKMEHFVGVKPEEYTVLLAHNPLCFEAYAAWGADLTLCGHIHGGMIRLPGGRGLLSPERTFFPKYSAGAYFIGEHEMIVSRGLAAGPRIGNVPELVELTLCAGGTMKKP